MCGGQAVDAARMLPLCRSQHPVAQLSVAWLQRPAAHPPLPRNRTSWTSSGRMTWQGWKAAPLMSQHEGKDWAVQCAAGLQHGTQAGCACQPTAKAIVAISAGWIAPQSINSVTHPLHPKQLPLAPTSIFSTSEARSTDWRFGCDVPGCRGGCMQWHVRRVLLACIEGRAEWLGSPETKLCKAK